MAIQRRRNRRPTKHRLHKPNFVDPFPRIPGTLPEKMLFATLYVRGIYFIYQGDFPANERKSAATLTMAKFDFKPDFILPEYKVILDPFGEFHHSLEEAAERDKWKWIVYTHQYGYAFYHPWAAEITNGGASAFLDTVTEFRSGIRFPLQDPKDIHAKATQGYLLGPNLGAGASSVGAANKARARGPGQLRLRRRR